MPLDVVPAVDSGRGPASRPGRLPRALATVAVALGVSACSPTGAGLVERAERLEAEGRHEAVVELRSEALADDAEELTEAERAELGRLARSARLAAVREPLPEEGCPHDEALARLERTWAAIDGVEPTDPLYGDFADVARRVERCRDELVEARLEALRPERRARRREIAERIASAFAGDALPVSEVRIDEDFSFGRRGPVRDGYTRFGEGIGLVVVLDEAVEGRREAAHGIAGLLDGLTEYDVRDRHDARVEAVRALFGDDGVPGFAEAGIAYLGVEDAEGDVHGFETWHHVSDVEHAAERLADGVDLEPAWFLEPLVPVDTSRALDAICDADPCECPDFAPAGSPPSLTVTGSRLVRLTEPSEPELVLSTTGCAAKAGPALLVFEPDPDRESGWRPVRAELSVSLEQCTIAELDSGEEVLGCRWRRTQTGSVWSIAKVVGELDGAIRERSVQQYHDFTALPSTPMGFPSDLDRRRRVTTKVVEAVRPVPTGGDGFAVEVDVLRSRAEPPSDRYDTWEEALDDGWLPPEPTLETERFRRVNGEFERVDDEDAGDEADD